jgi:uncharacterized damage-inducible protein DinB
MRVAIEHHSWATWKLVLASLDLSTELQESTIPGVFGSIGDTLQHVVGADRWYLFGLQGGPGDMKDSYAERLLDESTPLDQVLEIADENASRWDAVLAAADQDEMVSTRRLNGGLRHAPMSIRLAQAAHHGSDHRSQVCTVLTSRGVEPPAISVWDYASERGLLTFES